ncbi:peptidylprolyl isomerase [Mesonia ostreae]|uniref:peptidylprolyl isomerase n=1 Tax=Mesonia ostreae TaxID=861110 RepID=A0ABU2KLX8_9FLAO|nr:peptidylprolyl isomerase [Mesonia ostreae]MDT0295679.1 peptidylprolyl isomerase [Mesonia ostreae]
MSSRYSFIIALILLINLSCEDTKSEQKKIEKTKIELEKEKKRDSLLNAVKIPKGGKNFSVDLNEIETLEQEKLIPFLTQYAKENPETLVEISTSFGNITVRLYKNTPLHRANFLRLVKMGYFDTSFFHRVAKDFVIQGGNSDLEETHQVRHKVGSYLIPNEFKVQNTHLRGAFSAAKYSEQNVSKASSPFEFFIVQGENGAHHLDNDHTVFGKVISGMDVVDKIAQVEVDQSEWPKKNITMKIKVLR